MQAVSCTSIHDTHTCKYTCTHASSTYMIMCDIRTYKKYMYDTTYCTGRVVGDLVMRDLKTESGDTMIALGLMYTQVHFM